MSIFRTKKYRNCFHALRFRFYPKMRSQTRNPAASVIFKLLALFRRRFARVPAAVQSEKYRPPPISQATIHRRELAKRHDVPVRYLDIVLALGKVPYSVLFDHIRQGGVLRRDALIELRKRVPIETLAWLKEMEETDRFSDLLSCLATNKSEEETNVKMLAFVLRMLDQTENSSDLPEGELVYKFRSDFQASEESLSKLRM